MYSLAQDIHSKRKMTLIYNRMQYINANIKTQKHNNIFEIKYHIVSYTYQIHTSQDFIIAVVVSTIVRAYIFVQFIY